MLKKLVTVLFLTFIAAGVSAQQPKTAAKPQPAPKAEKPAPAQAPEPPPQPVNIKIEITITDQAGPGEPARKVVSMIVGDRQANSIRSNGNVRVENQSAPGAPRTFSYREVRINVDVRSVLLKDNKISLSLGLEYLPKAAPGGGEAALDPGLSSLNERLGLVVESGKTVMVSQAADPSSDRRITVEVTATILK